MYKVQEFDENDLNQRLNLIKYSPTIEGIRMKNPFHTLDQHRCPRTIKVNSTGQRTFTFSSSSLFQYKMNIYNVNKKRTQISKRKREKKRKNE